MDWSLLIIGGLGVLAWAALAFLGIEALMGRRSDG